MRKSLYEYQAIQYLLKVYLVLTTEIRDAQDLESQLPFQYFTV